MRDLGSLQHVTEPGGSGSSFWSERGDPRISAACEAKDKGQGENGIRQRGRHEPAVVERGYGKSSMVRPHIGHLSLHLHVNFAPSIEEYTESYRRCCRDLVIDFVMSSSECMVPCNRSSERWL